VNLILFTASYPYVRGNETSFLNIEVEYLRKEFDRVIVIPETIKDPVPVEHPGIEVDTSYANLMASKDTKGLAALAVSSPMFFQGMMEADFPRFSLTAWRRLIAFSGKAELTRRWALDYLLEKGLAPEDCLFYTYWFDHATAGIGAAKRQALGLKVVSRAHGYDIYEEHYYDPPFWPCRKTALMSTDRVFADSFAGTEYLKKRYPEFASLFVTSLLGVRDPGFITKPSMDKIFRVLSCSRIGAEKRVDLLMKSILIAARQRPGQQFEWHHFGNGEERERMQEYSDSNFPSNAKGHLPGFSNGEALMDFYKKNSADVFVNCSSTEGTSVAIMEAISCGIPVIATSVGGNTEIVSEQNGRLLPENPTPEEIAAAFFTFLDEGKIASTKREGSRKKWDAEYNADVNFREFARELAFIRKSGS